MEKEERAYSPPELLSFKEILHWPLLPARKAGKCSFLV
jgi:hypothetical protein